MFVIYDLWFVHHSANVVKASEMNKRGCLNMRKWAKRCFITYWKILWLQGALCIKKLWRHWSFRWWKTPQICGKLFPLCPTLWDILAVYLRSKHKRKYDYDLPALTPSSPDGTTRESERDVCPARGTGFASRVLRHARALLWCGHPLRHTARCVWGHARRLDAPVHDGAAIKAK